MFEDLTVFVVDDDEPSRKSVAALVRSMGVAVRDFASAEEFLAALEPDWRGCVVTDVRMVGLSGLELQQELRRRGAALPVIVMTAYPRTATTVQAMRAGAVTVLDKPYAEDDLWDAIRKALATAQETQRRLARRAELEARLARLTPDERAVMDLLVAGWANKQIAARRDIGLRTVEARRHQVHVKMGAGSLAELVRLAVEAGWTQSADHPPPSPWRSDDGSS